MAARYIVHICGWALRSLKYLHPLCSEIHYTLESIRSGRQAGCQVDGHFFVDNCTHPDLDDSKKKEREKGSDRLIVFFSRHDNVAVCAYVVYFEQIPT